MSAVVGHLPARSAPAGILDVDEGRLRTGRARHLACASPSCPTGRCFSIPRPILTTRATAWRRPRAPASRVPSNAVPATRSSISARQSSTLPSRLRWRSCAMWDVRSWRGSARCRTSRNGPSAWKSTARRTTARGWLRALVHLLVPPQRGAGQVAWLAEVVGSGAVYEAMAWTPTEAHRFLQAIPVFEAAGVVVRVPDWWRARRPPRPEVAVRVGEKKPNALGMDALLDFSVAVALGDERLPDAEVRQLMASSGVRMRLRGHCVELDRERLREVLAHWERVRREAEQGGLSFLEGMRLLAGVARNDREAGALAAGEGWSRVEAGAWLARTLEALRGTAGLVAPDPGADPRGTLRPYPTPGVAGLACAWAVCVRAWRADRT